MTILYTLLRAASSRQIVYLIVDFDGDRAFPVTGFLPSSPVSNYATIREETHVGPRESHTHTNRLYNTYNSPDGRRRFGRDDDESRPPRETNRDVAYNRCCVKVSQRRFLFGGESRRHSNERDKHK